MSKKKTIEYARIIFKNNGYKLLDTKYIDISKKMTAMDNNGYIIMSSLDNLRRGITPSVFSVYNPYTIKNIKVWLQLKNSPYTLVSTKYEGSNKKLILHCHKHGDFGVTLGNLKSGGCGCPQCGKESMARKQKLTLNEVKATISKVNPDVEILSNDYVNNSSKLHCKCNVCGNEWDISYSNLNKNRRCPKCINRELDGLYSLKNAEHNKDKWLNKDAIIYTIECWDSIEHFYKIGITTETIKSRFCGASKMPYHYRVLNEIHTNLYDAIYLEKYLHEKNKSYKYSTRIKFSGHTECFKNFSKGLIKGKRVIYIYENS